MKEITLISVWHILTWVSKLKFFIRKGPVSDDITVSWEKSGEGGGGGEKKTRGPPGGGGGGGVMSSLESKSLLESDKFYEYYIEASRKSHNQK